MSKNVLKIISVVCFALLLFSCKEVKKIKILEKEITIEVGEEKEIEVTNYSLDELIFESSNQECLQISKTNKLIVRAIKEGNVNLNIYVKDNNKINETIIIKIVESSVTINASDILLYMNSSIDINSISSVSNNIQYDFKYEVKDISIANIENNNLVAKSIGKTIINISIKDLNITKQINLEVKDILNCSDKEIIINEGQEINLYDYIENVNGIELVIKDNNIASLNNNIVKGLIAGNTTIEIKLNNQILDILSIVVKQEIIQPTEIETPDFNLNVGEEKEVIVNFIPSNVNSKEVTFCIESGNEFIYLNGKALNSNEVITVDLETEKLIVKGLSIGTSKLIVKANNIESIVNIEVINTEQVMDALNKALEDVQLLHIVSDEIEYKDSELEFKSQKSYTVQIEEIEVTIEYLIAESTIIRKEEDYTIDVVVKAFIGDDSITKTTQELVVLSINNYVKSIKELLNIPSEINDDITLPSSIDNVEIEWTSKNAKVLSNKGICSYVEKDTAVVLEVLFIYNDTFIDDSYNIIVKPYAEDRRINEAINHISVPSIVSCNIFLPMQFSYDVEGEWSSSNPEIINQLGHVSLTNKEENVTLTFTVINSLNQEIKKEFLVQTKAINLKENEEYFGNHTLVNRASQMVSENMENLEYKDGVVVLKDGALTGTYVSKIFVTNKFDELVGSWAAITSLKYTCELMVRVRINGIFSKYFSYGQWGLGRTNVYYNQSDTYSKMSVDEIIMNSGYYADAFQYKIVLKRDSETDESPKLALVAATLSIPNYKYGVDSSNFKNKMDYDVPKVNQNVVPTIGSVICSATTTTMLLKYKGFNFSSYDTYENRYIARLVADTGHNSPTYGNWTYNMAVAGAYGLNAYVARMYSWDELRYHLDNVGPVGASISGNFGLYETGGHLIVVRGYRIENGKTYIITNDPNVNSRFGANYFVYYEVTLEMFLNVWRGMTYIVE